MSMSEDERQRRIRHYEEMERTVSFAPDKAVFRRQADELRAAEPRSFAPPQPYASLLLNPAELGGRTEAIAK